MTAVDPLCDMDESWHRRSRPCVMCKFLRKVRAEERRIMAEDIANMLRFMPYANVKTPAALEWAHRYVTDIWDDDKDTTA